MANPTPPSLVGSANWQSDTVRKLLHGPGILVMPGAYDALSARLFEALGFPAIQGSSVNSRTDSPTRRRVGVRHRGEFGMSSGLS